MTSTQVELQLIALIVAAACALPGVFLVLRQMAMMSDAISHTVLLGIVLMFFAVGSLDSPLLILGAAAMGCSRCRWWSCWGARGSSSRMRRLAWSFPRFSAWR